MTSPLPTSYRSYQDKCPSCGAPVAFRSAHSAFAVCSYCRSTVARSGEVLSRIGQMAEVFDDHSPLQLLAQGRVPAFAGEASRAAHAPPPPAGAVFTVVGRVQWQGDAGRWSEWHVLLEDGQRATLSEDQGRYVFTWPLPPSVTVPPLASLRMEQPVAIDGRPFTVSAVMQAMVIAAEGELPALPALGHAVPLAELRSPDGVVVSIEGHAQPPDASWGRSVALEDLRMSGLRKGNTTKEDQGQRFSCPSCGSPVKIQLSTSKSITCPACRSVIQLDSGVGSQLSHALQRQHIQPKIAIGSMGTFEEVSWQVLGFQRRGGSSDGEAFSWDEYLLYHLEKGFCFLVDSADGWSLSHTLTGAPKLQSSGRVAQYHGHSYQLVENYHSSTQYVEGEFYWPVKVGERTEHSDYRWHRSTLARERSANEVTWSQGQPLSVSTVTSAFGLDPSALGSTASDAGSTTGSGGISVFTMIMIFVFVVILLSILSNCSDNGTGGRTSGGSYGGFSTGGGHK